MNNRNLSYKAFLEALALVAFELDCKFEDVAAMLGVEAVQDRREESDASDVRYHSIGSCAAWVPRSCAISH